jgi:hypothetical protein
MMHSRMNILVRDVLLLVAGLTLASPAVPAQVLRTTPLAQPSSVTGPDSLSVTWPGPNGSEARPLAKHVVVGALLGGAIGFLWGRSADRRCADCMFPMTPLATGAGAVIGVLGGIIVWRVRGRD